MCQGLKNGLPADAKTKVTCDGELMLMKSLDAEESTIQVAEVVRAADGSVKAGDIKLKFVRVSQDKEVRPDTDDPTAVPKSNLDKTPRKNMAVTLDKRKVQEANKHDKSFDIDKWWIDHTGKGTPGPLIVKGTFVKPVSGYAVLNPGESVFTDEAVCEVNDMTGKPFPKNIPRKYLQLVRVAVV